MSILQLPSTKLAPPAGDPLSPSATGTPGAAPEAPFAAILDGERGRTDDGGRVDDSRRDRDDRDTPSMGEDATDSAATATSVVVAAALPVDTSAAVAARTPGAADSSPTFASGDAGQAAAAVSAASTGAATSGAPAASTGAATSGAPAATPAATDGSAAAGISAPGPALVAATSVDASAVAHAPAGEPVTTMGPGPGEAVTAPDSGGANPQSVAPRATPVHQGTPSDSLPDGPQEEASTSAASSAPVADGAKQPTSGAGAAAPIADAAPQASSAPTGPAVAPSVASEPLDGSVPVVTVPSSRGVGLDRAVETVRLALRAAADRGVMHARISLNPRELGGIEIHLRHTADGLVARVVAEHAGAAQLLQHAGGELRRALEAQGVTLLQLDIGASADQGGRTAGEQRGFGEAGSRRADGSASAGEDASLAAPGDAPAPDSTLALANGVLVDVLA